MGLRPGQVNRADDPVFRRVFGQMVQAPREGSHAEKPPPAPAPTQQVVVNRFIIEPLPPNIQRAIALRKRTIDTKPSGGNKSTSYHEEKGSEMGVIPDKMKAAGAFLMVGVLMMVAFVFSTKTSEISTQIAKDDLVVRNGEVDLETKKIANAERRARLEREMNTPVGQPGSRPHDVPEAQRAPLFPSVRSLPCTSGSPGERASEGYEAPYRATGGFDVYAGCAWVIVPFATYNIQITGNVKLEHPESGQSCSDATGCVHFLNRVWQQSGDKRVRVFVSRGSEFTHWGPKT